MSSLKQAVSDHGLDQLSEAQLQGVIDALTLALWADGTPRPEEVQALTVQLEATPWFVGKAQPEIDALFAHSQQLVDRLLASGAPDGLATTLGAIGQTLASDPLRELVFRMAINLLLADRQVSPEEEAVTRAFALAFGISKERARQIVLEQVRASV